MAHTNRRGFAVRLGPRLVEILLCVLIAWLCARGVWGVVLGPVSQTVPVVDRKASTDHAAFVVDYSAITEFDPFVGHSAPVPDAGTAIFEDVRPTSLNITLHGVWAWGEPAARSAIIKVENEKQKLYYIGDTIGDVAAAVTLTDVFNTYAIISRNGIPEKLILVGRKAQKEKIHNIRHEADRPVTTQAYGNTLAPLPSSRSNGKRHFEGFINQVQIHILRDAQGKKKAYALYPKNANALFAQAGLMPGDVLQKLNGQPVPNSPEGFLDRLSALSAEEFVVLEVGRGSGIQEIKLKLADFSN